MTLKLNGYSTAQFGKCHEVPVWETSPLGPFDQWPTGGGGFEYFYGFIGGETNQWYPAIYEGTTPMEQEQEPGGGLPLHRGHDEQGDRVGAPAEGADARQAVLHVFRARRHPRPASRAEGVDRQVQGQVRRRLGQAARRDVCASEEAGRDSARRGAHQAARRNPGLRRHARRRSSRFSRARWRSTPASSNTPTTTSAGCSTRSKELEILDDTLIYYIFGDNGASAEGTPNGCFNEVAVLNGMGTLETPEFLMSKIDDFGGPDAYNHYAVGWAHAMNTPYQWTKQVASHFGGTRNGTIVHWPRRHQGQGRNPVAVLPRDRYRADDPRGRGIPAPTIVNGIQQAPYEGASMLYAFNDAKAAERRETQYFEMFCNRGIYHKGWTAVTRHGVPWVGSYKRAFDDDVWELYDTNTDWTQSKDLAKEHPKKLAELQRLFLIEATKYSVLPLDDRTFERFNPDLAGRPQLIKGNSQILFGGMSRLSEGSLVVTKNKSYSMTAEIEVPAIRRQRRHRRAWAAASAAGASTP